jgi:hypothetical protein
MFELAPPCFHADSTRVRAGRVKDHMICLFVRRCGAGNPACSGSLKDAGVDAGLELEEAENARDLSERSVLGRLMP